jgi:hypothetical protein
MANFLFPRYLGANHRVVFRHWRLGIEANFVDFFSVRLPHAG